MRKLLTLSTLLICLTLVSCDKNEKSCGFADSTKVATEAEISALSDSLQKYGIHNALQHPSGLFYTIGNQGSGNFVANLCSTVSATYWGGFFNGQGFDSSLVNPIPFVLGQVIVGWQKALPLVKEGGQINIYIPPSLGYGASAKYGQNGQLLIPANSYLVFKVNVTKIQ